MDTGVEGEWKFDDNCQASGFNAQVAYGENIGRKDLKACMGVSNSSVWDLVSWSAYGTTNRDIQEVTENFKFKRGQKTWELLLYRWNWNHEIPQPI